MAVTSVIVFDLDDTLYLERDYVESGLRAVGAWAAGQIGITGLAAVMLERFRSGQRVRLFDDGLVDRGHPPSPALIARMLRVYRQHRPRIVMAADAAAFMAARPPGTGLAIITDGFRDAQTRKLRALHVHDHGVALAVCTDRWGRGSWKPSRRAFDHVAAHFGLPADRFCYVGDNPEKDFHAPLALGWRTVQIVRSGIVPRPMTPATRPAERRIASFDNW